MANENAIRTDNNVPCTILDNWNGETVRLKWDSKWGVMTSSKWWNWVESDITSDAWGRSKFIEDFSLFHWLFTYNIPSQLWLTFENWTEVSASTRVTVVDWAASISSWWTTTNTAFLRSKRHPRYQPNRGHLWSTAWFLPNPTATWIRQLGLLNTIAWVYFQLEDGILYAVVFNDNTEKLKAEIDISLCWLTISDLQFWSLYDIQYQWRGVWDYFFYINQKLVYKTSFLWNNTELTIFNPALSAWFYAENTNWTEVEIKIWCADITSEWWKAAGATYVSIANSTTKAVNTTNYPTIIAHVKQTLNSLPNTRDVLALRATWSSDQRSYMKAYITRNTAALTWASFNDAQQWSWVEFDVAATSIDTWLCQLLWSRRVQIDNNTSVDLPSDLVDFYLTEWDYLIITMERESPTQTSNVVVSLELWEEI